MKRLFHAFCLIGTIFMTASCGIFAPSAPDPLAAEATVESGIYVTVNTIIPSTGRTVHTSDGYYLSIKDGKASSYLPFIGTSYSATSAYGGESGYILKDEAVQITESEKKGIRSWDFTVKRGTETIRFTLDFSDSGKATITALSTVRSLMRYNGDVTEQPASN